MKDKQVRSDKEWKRILTPEQFRVARKSGTERPFTGLYYDHDEVGQYKCICCKSALFDSTTKFDSGTGWPSFYAAVDSGAVSLKSDRKLLIKRTEAVCSKCEAHLGHVFNDGPKPSGKRYCINSLSLEFEKEKENTSDS